MQQSRCAVVGHPIEHSLSPALHRAAYAACDLDWCYEAVDVEPGRLASFVDSLDSSWRGLSVTMPHKRDLLAIGEADQMCMLVGAANTLLLSGGRRLIRNTDVGGFVTAVVENQLTGVVTARILGAGSTARAAIVALAKLGCRYVNICVRTPHKAIPLIDVAHEVGLEAAVDRLGDEVAPADLVCNTLPPRVVDPWVSWAITEADAVFDVGYEPWPTSLTQAGHEEGLVNVTGLDLLAGQAVEQVALMTGHEVPFSLLREAGLARLVERRQRTEAF